MKPIFIITLFESYFSSLVQTGVVGSALRGERGEVPEIKFLNPSDFSEKGFKGVDSSPYGGGAGQVMRGDVLESCLLEGVKLQRDKHEVIYLGPRGKIFSQKVALNIKNEFLTPSSQKSLVFICGRYEGVDERFLKKYVDRTISLGDFVLSGGEVALGVILDSILRLCDGVLSNSESPLDESFSDGLLEYPQYTKPQLCCGEEVPAVLLSGNHQRIASWRIDQKKELTMINRPDLYNEYLKQEGK